MSKRASSERTAAIAPGTVRYRVAASPAASETSNRNASRSQYSGWRMDVLTESSCLSVVSAPPSSTTAVTGESAFSWAIW